MLYLSMFMELLMRISSVTKRKKTKPLLLQFSLICLFLSLYWRSVRLGVSFLWNRDYSFFAHLLLFWMIRFFQYPVVYRQLPLIVNRVGQNCSLIRCFSSKKSTNNPFITVPEDKIDINISRYKAVGGSFLKEWIYLRKCSSEWHNITCSSLI